jgi:CCR4-NOT transcription complex subunit 1
MNIGYCLTSTPQALREGLAAVGRGSRVYGLLPFTEAEVARLLVTMGNSMKQHGDVGPPPNPVAALGPLLDNFAAAASKQPVYASGRVAQHAPGPDTWNHNVVARVLQEDAAHLDWARVVAALDFPECSLASTTAFNFVVVVTHACNNGVFPTAELLRKPWSNARAHVDALRHAISAPPDYINFTYGALAPDRIMPPVPGSSAGTGTPNSAWCSVDLYSILLRLASGGGPDVERAVAGLLEGAQMQVPELVLLGVARTKLDDKIDSDPSGQDPNGLRARIYNTLLTTAFGNLLVSQARVPPTALQQSILTRLWETSCPLAATSLLALVRGIANRAGNEHEQLRTSMEGVARVVALVQHLPDFAAVLLSAPAPQLVLEVAAYCAAAPPDLEARLVGERVPAAWQGPEGTGGLKLEAWLASCLSTQNPAAAERFAIACVAFLKRVIASQSLVLGAARARTGAPMDGSGAATNDAVAAAKAVAAAGGALTPDSAKLLQGAAAESAAMEAAAKEAVIREDVLAKVFKALKVAAAGAVLTGPTQTAMTACFEASARMFPALAEAVHHDVEDTANALFQRVYTGGLSIADAMDYMRRYKASNDPREREIFNSMVRNLFDEYRFFAQYPEKELRITGVLFGQLIAHQLVVGTTLGVALRCVLEALRKPPTAPASAKMYRFGMYALEQFKGRLPKWPQYCSHVTAIPHLREQYPQFVAEIDAAVAAQGAGRPGGIEGGPGAGLNLLGGEPLLGGDGSGLGAGGSLPPVLGSVDAAGGQSMFAASFAAEAAAPPTPAPTPTAPSAPVGRPAGPHSDMRARLAALGADLTVALAAASSGQPIPAILPSAAAQAAAAKEAEEKAAATILAAGGSDAGGGRGGSSSSGSDGGPHMGGGGDRTIEAPSAALIERFSFLLNNLTDINTATRSSEFAALLRAEHVPWVSSVIVKRAATQANYQPAMQLLLDSVGQRDLDREVLRATLDSVRKLLGADKERARAGAAAANGVAGAAAGAAAGAGGTAAERQERTMLKNLGAWMGRITLSRNRPLLHRDLNVKELLHEAYEQGRLISVVAFVAKLMEGVSESGVFRPPNPWSMAVMAALRELYDVTDLKLNLKFEVEVLAKHLGVELKDVRPARILPTRRRPDLRNNLDFNQKAAAAPELIPGIAARDGASATGGSAPSAAPGGTPAIPGLIVLTSLKAFGPVFHPVAETGGDAAAAAAAAAVDPGADADEVGGPKAALRNIVAVALDRAVRELIQPVVERSVTIAVITSRELVLKDFACEPDADRISRAAHVLASDLAGSLAVITCTEPIKGALGNHLRSLLTAHPTVITCLPVSLASLGDAGLNAMLTGVVADNTEVASLLVEKAAMERAVRAIDEALASHYAARRTAADVGVSFTDTAVLTAAGKWQAALPEALRPRVASAGLSSAQLRVYESFSRGSTAATEAGAAAASAAGAAAGPAFAGDEGRIAGKALGGGTASATPEALAAFGAPATPSPLSDAGGSAAGAPVVGQPLTPGQANQEYNAALERLTASIRSTAITLAATAGVSASAVTPNTLSSLPADSELLASLRELRAIGMRLVPGDAREQVCQLQAQKLLKGLLELAPTPVSVLDTLAGSVYVASLGVLKELTRALRRDMVVYLTRVAEEPKQLFACDGVVASLARAGLLHIPDLDGLLAKAGAAAIDPRAPPGAGNAGLQFMLRVTHRLVVSDRIVGHVDMPQVMDLLVAAHGRFSSSGIVAAAAGGLPASLGVLLEAIKAVAASSGGARPPGGWMPLPTAIAAVQGPILLTGPLPPQPNGIAAAAAAVVAAQADGYSEDVRQRVLYLLETWVRLCAEASVGAATDKHYSQYVSVLVQQGVLTNDASTERFFRIMVDLCVQSCAATAKPYPEDRAVPPAALAAPTTNMATTPVPTPRMRLTYTGVDALSKLVVLLLKVAGEHAHKVTLLQKLMGIFARTLIRDADANGGGCTPELAAGGAPPPDSRFDSRAYLRLFCNMLRDLHMSVPAGAGAAAEGTPEREREVADTINFNAQVLATFANVFHLTQPARVPGFAFAWLELVSHRLFLPALLAVPLQRGWPLVHRLLVHVLRFLFPFTRRGELNDGLRLLHKGVLRLLFVLHADAPDFLADYAWTLLELLPVHATQARNIITAAAPRAVRLPEPVFRGAPGALPPPSLESLTEAAIVPRVLGTPSDALPPPLRDALEAYMRTASHGPTAARSASAAQLAATIRTSLLADAEESAATLGRYSPRIIGGLVQTLLSLACARLAADGTAGVEFSPSRIPPAALTAAATSGPLAELLRATLSLAPVPGGGAPGEDRLDAEGRYLVVHTLSAHLRFPSAHTVLAVKLLTALYTVDGAAGVGKGTDRESVLGYREALVRVLLERLIAHRPHPWGVVYLFVELLRGPAYALAGHAFLHGSPEVERLFDTVARSVGGVGGAVRT